MRKLAIKMMLFMALCGVTILFSIWFPLQLIKNQADFGFDYTVQHLILGASQPECAFNDSLIANAKNMAHSGESYFYTFIKLRKLLEDNPEVKNVFIEYSRPQLNSDMNNNIWGDKYLNWRYPKYAAFFSLEELKLIGKNNIRGLVSIQRISTTENIKWFFEGKNKTLEYFDWGGYLYLERNKTDSLLQNHKYGNIRQAKQNISEINLASLRNIHLLCKQFGVQLIFINTPVHTSFLYYRDDPLLKKIHETEFKEVPILNFKKFPLTNQEFGDLGHLNHRGAKKFSKFFNLILIDGLMNSEDIQGQIEKTIAKQILTNS